MNQYKTLIIYSISNDQLKKLFENELEKYGLERVGEQGIFALPLEEYRTKVQAFKAYLRAYSRKHLDSQDTVLFVESRMNEERTLTTMLQTNLMSEEGNNTHHLNNRPTPIHHARILGGSATPRPPCSMRHASRRRARYRASAYG